MTITEWADEISMAYKLAYKEGYDAGKMDAKLEAIDGRTKAFEEGMNKGFEIIKRLADAAE